MKKRRQWLWWLSVALVVLLIIAGVSVVRLKRSGYLPQPITLTAEAAPTAIPLSTPTQTTVPTTGPTSTRAPVPTASPTHQAPTSTPNAPPTRIAAPAETIDLPEGFAISIFAEGLAQPRMMALDPDGHLHVAERGARRIIRLPDRDQDGVADGVEVITEDLNAPSSLAFYRDGSLYVGETTRVLRLHDRDSNGVFQAREVIIEGLPQGGHNTRTVLFSPDWSALYVSIGSSCNVCRENDERRATIMRYAPDGSAGRVYARGLRNAVGITFRPGATELWATNNGRDWLGDDQPPETIYHVQEGSDAGWPRCHSGRIVDPEFGSDGDCDGVLAPVVEMQAHAAPLGLTFYTGTQFPAPYRGALFVAFHGSWNRSEPTGYKVVWIPMQDGTPGPVQDFAAGWLRDDGSNWGRPVDVITAPDGSLFISDDAGGIIYRIFHVRQ